MSAIAPTSSTLRYSSTDSDQAAGYPLNSGPTKPCSRNNPDTQAHGPSLAPVNAVRSGACRTPSTCITSVAVTSSSEIDQAVTCNGANRRSRIRPNCRTSATVVVDSILRDRTNPLSTKNRSTIR